MWSGGADGAAGQAWDAHPLDTAAVHPIGRKMPATPEDAPGVARGWGLTGVRIRQPVRGQSKSPAVHSIEASLCVTMNRGE